MPLVDFPLLGALAPAIPALAPGAGKGALARVTTVPLSDEIVTRAKTGFSVPTSAWMDATARDGSGSTGRAAETKGPHFSPLVAGCAKRSGPNEATTGSARVMKPLPAMLAIVTDAYGGRGGIAQYNRDFLGALAETGTVSSITVLPRQAPDSVVRRAAGVRAALNRLIEAA